MPLPAAGSLAGDDRDGEVVAGIETDRGPWVAALVAAGYLVFPVNPVRAWRYRGRPGVPGARSDGADARMLADMVRADSRQRRPAAGDSAGAEGIKVPARARKTLIRERTRQLRRMRARLREYCPGRAGSLRGPGRRQCAGPAGPGPRTRPAAPG